MTEVLKDIAESQSPRTDRRALVAICTQHWRLLSIAGFIGLMAGWIIVKPGSPAVYGAVVNLAQLTGPLLAVLWCVPFGRLRRRAAIDKTVPRRRNRATISTVCLLLGVTGFAAGQAIWSYDEIVLGLDAPFPSWADAGFVASYLFLFIGVMRLPSRPLPALAKWRILLDSVTSMTALVTFSWYFILAPMLAQGSQSSLGKILGVFYPMADLALLFCVLMLTSGRTGKAMRGGILSLSAGLIAIIVIDTAFAYGTLNGIYETGGILDLLWPLGYMLIGHAAWQIQKASAAEAAAPLELARPSDRKSAPQGPSLLQSLLPYAFMPPAIALLCFVYGVGGWDWRSWGVYGGAASLMMLVLARQFFVVCENERLYRTLKEIHVELAESHQSLETANRQLHALATTDGLTRLANHRTLQDRLREESLRSQRSGEPVALLLLDVDRFKDFNDSFGHPAGDEVLRTVAALMQSCVRETDLSARYGGEEFAILMPGVDPETAMAVAERLRTVIAGHDFEHRRVTASIGVACGEPGFSPDVLIEEADRALYQSKSGGRDRVTGPRPASAAA